MNTDIKINADENSESMENKNMLKKFNVGDIVQVYGHYSAFVVCDKPELQICQVIISGMPSTKFFINYADLKVY